MRTAIVLLSIIIVFAACQKAAVISLKHNNQKKIIALQPLDTFDRQQLLSIQNELHDFFNIPVVIFDPIVIEPSIRTPYHDIFVADSILPLLTKQANDSVVVVIVMTHKEIFRLKQENMHLKNTDSSMYFFDNVVGYAFLSENSFNVLLR
jgi:hypothetical protein